MKLLPILNTSQLTAKDLACLFKRSENEYSAIAAQIKPIMERIKDGGDEAISEWNKQNGIKLNNWKLTKKQIQQASSKVSPAFITAAKQTIANVATLSKARKMMVLQKQTVAMPGTTISIVWRALERVGIYIPGGKTIYPSTLIMCAVPALIAGCRELVICSNPDSAGIVAPEICAVAELLGITEIYAIGGPAAITAMAYGTKTIKSVDKIVGPGSIYVTTAKNIVFPKVSIDLPAGPSENLIIADDSANPNFVAADLITDAEHGVDSTAVLLTPSLKLANTVRQKIVELTSQLPTKKTIEQALTNYGRIIVTKNVNEAIDLANQYAPEHLQIMTTKPNQVANKIVNAGSVLIGPWTAKAAADYAIGGTHVLPTGGAAKNFSGLDVTAFGKWIEIQKITEKRLRELGDGIKTFADAEKFPAHKLSYTIRQDLASNKSQNPGKILKGK